MDVKRYCIVDKKRGLYLTYGNKGGPLWSNTPSVEFYPLDTVSLVSDIPVWTSKDACKNYIKYQLLFSLRVSRRPFSDDITITPGEIHYKPKIVEVYVPNNRLKKTNYKKTDPLPLENLISLQIPTSVKKKGFYPSEFLQIAYLSGTAVSDYVVKVAARGRYEFNFPQDLLKDLCLSAKNNNRTFSDEITHRLVEQQANGKEASDGR